MVHIGVQRVPSFMATGHTLKVRRTALTCKFGYTLNPTAAGNPCLNPKCILNNGFLAAYRLLGL